MENFNFANPWETVFVPKEASMKRFKSEKTGRELCEIDLPDELPEGSPKCGGWHFYMPGSCVAEVENGASLKFPPSWVSIRFLSPYVPGKRSDIIEYPIEEALALLRATFAQY